MSVGIRFNSTEGILLSSEFFMARRPVLDRHQRPFAHELVFSSGGPSVIEDVCRHGLSRMLGDLPGLFPVDATTLMSDAVLLLPPASVILDLAVPEIVSPALLARCAVLAGEGYRFALRADGGQPALCALLPLAVMVCVDISGRDEQGLRASVARVGGRPGTRLCAMQVDSREQYARCAEAGYELFQGYFFAVPQLQPGKTFMPSQHAIAELLALLATDADNAAIEHGIKADVRLGLNLLKLASSPLFSVHPVDSLRQALMALGRNELQRWLHMLLYAQAEGQGAAIEPLGSMALTRARFMELAAHKLMPGNRGIADTAFTVGIMSLMDSLFGMPMEDILRQIPVVEEVRDALLGHRGFHGTLLDLAIEAESLQHPERLRALALALRLTCNDLYAMQLAAFEWSDHASHSLHAPN